MPIEDTETYKSHFYGLICLTPGHYLNYLAETGEGYLWLRSWLRRN